MMQKNLEKIPASDTDVKFGHLAMMLTDWVDTTVMAVVAGRGTAKSTVIISRRSYRCITLMPGAPIAVIADTYSNLVSNIMPAVQHGWKLQGLIEGVHYVKGRRPPEEWRRKCSIIVDDYKHVYSFWNGSVLFLGSIDSPSLLAGKSVVHLLYDEAKYAKDSKVARAMPILRGDAVSFGHCHLFLGITVTTDMPDVTEGEYDWFFRYAAEMDADMVVKIVQVADLRNRELVKLVRETSKAVPDEARLRRLEKKVSYYDNALLKMRKGQTSFFNFSSFVNVDILTSEYLERLYNGTLELHDFLKSVVGMKPGVRKDLRFYVLFGEQHKYFTGTLSGEAAYYSRELRYLHIDKPIDAGVDFGNMLSLVIAQQDGAYYRVHKNFFELPPGWFRELADKFLDFFQYHERKEINIWYDRAGNNFERQGEDYASKLKDAIEKDASGYRTGWVVNLMSRKQATIRQDAEFNFMHELMSGENRYLPTLQIDAVNCPELVSSIEGAKAEVRYKGSVKVVSKVKRTEKLEPKKLPKLSTNFSDAFKYLMMRAGWLKLLNGKRAGSASDSSVAEWLKLRNK